jgi:hypothetical protein
MKEPTESILSYDEGQSLGNRLRQGFARASPLPSQKGLEFGESPFNRREIGRVSRQKQETTPYATPSWKIVQSRDQCISEKHGGHL